MTVPEYIIEHETRGVLVEQEFESVKDGWRSKFRWSIPRTEGMRMRTPEVRRAWSRLSEKEQERSKVRLFGTWQEVVL